MEETGRGTAGFHLPGLFEFYDFYRVFLPLYREHREFFYDQFEIASLYGAPEGCLWGGGRVGDGNADPKEVFALTREYGISAHLTFSNSLLREEHLSDGRCNSLCALLEKSGGPENGVIVHSDLLLGYLRQTYPGLCFTSSTTKVLTDFSDFRKEAEREEFRFVVPDFRLNRAYDVWRTLPAGLKRKVEFLCNECCDVNCRARKACYESVSRKTLGEANADFRCTAPGASRGYRFSEAMKNPAFLGPEEIREILMPMGYTEFKLEGRGLGSAVVLEILLWYLVRPEYRLRVREEIYLDSMLDLF